jgi:hypothetical protein
MPRFKIVERPVPEISAIMTVVAARLNGDPQDSFDWEVIRGQLATATRIAKDASLRAKQEGR